MRKNQIIFISLIAIGIGFLILSIQLSKRNLRSSSPKISSFPANYQTTTQHISSNFSKKETLPLQIKNIKPNKENKEGKKEEKKEKKTETKDKKTQEYSQKQTFENKSSQDAYNSYIKNLGEIWSKVGFTTKEFNSIQKTKKGRILCVEELIQKIIENGYSQKIISSLISWKKLDENSFKKLKKLAPTTSVSFYHQNLLNWYNYRVKFIDNVIKNKPAQNTLKSLFQQYQNKASYYLSSYRFSFIPKAYAALPFYHFGGRIISHADYCTNGLAIYVGPPRGGLLWIYYSVWAANPFLYKNLAVGCQILGRALPGPGVCNQGPINYPIGMAQILFFGSTIGPL